MVAMRDCWGKGLSMNSLKLALSVVMLAVAVFLFVRFLRQDDNISEKAFFYDLSEKKLFAGPRKGVPPIRGINDEAEDAVRAVVISTNGNPRDKKSWKVTYLETYSPELKKQFQTAQTRGSSPVMGRVAAQSHRLVRRLQETQWFSLNSSEGEKIVSEWLTAGTGGTPAVICSP